MINNHMFVEKLKDGTLTAEDMDELGNAFCKKAVQEALRVMPEVIDHLVRNADLLHKMSQGFYRNNPELEKHRKLVAESIEAIEVQNPGMPYTQILEKAAVEVKGKVKQLGLAEKPKKDPKVSEIDSALGEL